MAFETALAQHEAVVDALIKEASRYTAALKKRKKACKGGNMADRQKAADQAIRLAVDIASSAQVAGEWSFDVRAWLASRAWRGEIADALDATGLIAIEAPSDKPAGALVCPPLPLLPEPDKVSVRAGRNTFRSLRPSFVAAEIQRLRARVAGAKTQEFLESLYAMTRHLAGASDLRATFRAIYTLFSLSPGWKKENTELDFGQRVYALRESGLRTTKDGKRFQIQIPSGTVKKKDIFRVYGDDGREHLFYAIRFF